MFKYSILSLLVILLFFQDAQAQANQAEFQTSLLGTVHYSKRPTKLLSDFGINYQPFLFKQTYLVLGLQGNARNYNQDGGDTLKPYTGELLYQQWMASVGVRHLFRPEVVETFNYFAEANFHYMRLKTEGDFKGGDFGEGYYAYNRFRGVGLGFKTGSVYQFNSPWYVGVNAALNLTGGKTGESVNYGIPTEADRIIDEFPLNTRFTSFGIELRVGYRFYKK